MQKLIEIQRDIIFRFEAQELYPRELYDHLNLDNYCTGIVGPRGVGKTTLLLKVALDKGLKEGKAMYVSADHVHFVDNTLYDLVEKLVKSSDVGLLCVDEIHKHPNWHQQLKSIADTFSDFRILFTGSSMIDIIRGKYDLSRRVTLHRLNGLSYREYLGFAYDIHLPKVSLEELTDQHEKLINQFKLKQPLKLFDEYLKQGYYPFFKKLTLDQDLYQAIANSIQKTIYEDIAVCHSMKTSTLMVLENILKYTISTSPGEITPAKLASTMGKDFQSVSSYCQILNQAGLLNHLYTAKPGKAQLKNPVKMYPDNTNMIFAIDPPVFEDALKGRLRETFVINQLVNAKYQVYYSEQGDFEVAGLTVEVGGPNKTAKQIRSAKKGIVATDGIEHGHAQNVPLFLFGFLY